MMPYRRPSLSKIAIISIACCALVSCANAKNNHQKTAPSSNAARSGGSEPQASRNYGQDSAAMDFAQDLAERRGMDADWTTA